MSILEPEDKYLNINGIMTLGAYRLLEQTHDISWRKGYVFFKSRSNSRPNLEFYLSNMPVEMLNMHKED